MSAVTRVSGRLVSGVRSDRRSRITACDAFGAPAQGGGGLPGPGGAPGPVPDVIAPVIAGLKLSRTKLVRGKSIVFRFSLSEPGSVAITIARLVPGRRVRGRCVKPTRKLRRRPRCTRAVRVGVLRRAGVPAGPVSVRFNGRFGRRKVPLGRYRGTVVVTDAAGNRSRAVRVGFRVVRR